MFRRLILIALLILLTAWIASILAASVGVTTIDWLGYRIEIMTSLLVALLAAAVIALVMLDRLAGFFMGLPGRIGEGIKQRRRAESHEALALGLVTAAMGDAAGASKHARRAKRLGGAGTLTGLLDAQVATLKGDDKAAGRFFGKLAKNRATAWLGHAATMRLKDGAGDHKAALEAGRAALAARKNDPATAKALFVLEARAGNWREAIAALKIAGKDSKGAEDKRKHAKAMAVLHYEEASRHLQDGAEDDALKAATEAVRCDPGLIAAVLDAAAILHSRRKTRQAIALLEKSFLKAPHPDTAALLLEYYPATPAKNLSRLMQLADKGGNKIEAVSACASRALDLELWGEAVRLAGLIPEAERDAVLWSVLAEVGRNAPAKGKKNNWPDPETCLMRAAKAPRAAAWTCNACGALSLKWQSRCGACDAFASLEWRMAKMH